MSRDTQSSAFGKGGDYIPLLLSVKRGTWRQDDSAENMESSDKEFQDVRKSILVRDGHVCQGCGFRSNAFQEVHHRDDDHSNNAKENLITLCTFCHKTFHLGFCGLGEFGTIIYLPELSQTALNNIVRMIGIGVSSKERKWRDICQEVYEQLRVRANDMDTTFKEYFVGFPNPPSNPLTIASILSSIDDEDYARREAWVKDFRILHDPTKYKQQIDFWAKEMGTSMPVKSWERVFQSLDSRLKRNQSVG